VEKGGGGGETFQRTLVEGAALSPSAAEKRGRIRQLRQEVDGNVLTHANHLKRGQGRMRVSSKVNSSTTGGRTKCKFRLIEVG